MCVLVFACDKSAQIPIRSQKTHVSGSLVQVAHDDVDHILRLCANGLQDIADLFANQARDQMLFQAPQAGSGGSHGGQDGLRFSWAIHLGR